MKKREKNISLTFCQIIMCLEGGGEEEEEIRDSHFISELYLKKK